jgi:hypothetical protein
VGSIPIRSTIDTKTYENAGLVPAFSSVKGKRKPRPAMIDDDLPSSRFVLCVCALQQCTASRGRRTIPFAGVIGGLNGVCAQSMAIDASANTYLLDAETYSLDRVDGTTRNLATIGALGFAFGRVAAMDIDPTSGMLFLYDFDGTHAVYAVGIRPADRRKPWRLSETIFPP